MCKITFNNKLTIIGRESSSSCSGIVLVHIYSAQKHLVTWFGRGGGGPFAWLYILGCFPPLFEIPHSVLALWYVWMLPQLKRKIFSVCVSRRGEKGEQVCPCLWASLQCGFVGIVFMPSAYINLSHRLLVLPTAETGRSYTPSAHHKHKHRLLPVDIKGSVKTRRSFFSVLIYKSLKCCWQSQFIIQGGGAKIALCIIVRWWNKSVLSHFMEISLTV